GGRAGGVGDDQGPSGEGDGGGSATGDDAGCLDGSAVDVERALAFGGGVGGGHGGGEGERAVDGEIGGAVDVDGTDGLTVGAAGVKETDGDGVGVDGTGVEGENARAADGTGIAFASAADAEIIDEGIHAAAREIIGGRSIVRLRAGRAVADHVNPDPAGRAIGAADEGGSALAQDGGIESNEVVAITAAEGGVIEEEGVGEAEIQLAAEAESGGVMADVEGRVAGKGTDTVGARGGIAGAGEGNEVGGGEIADATGVMSGAAAFNAKPNLCAVHREGIEAGEIETGIVSAGTVGIGTDGETASADGERGACAADGETGDIICAEIKAGGTADLEIVRHRES